MMLREKPGAKGCILCNSIGVKCPEQAGAGFRQQISGCRLGLGRRVAAAGTRGLTGMMDCGDYYTAVLIINSHLVINQMVELCGLQVTSGHNYHLSDWPMEHSGPQVGLIPDAASLTNACPPHPGVPGLRACPGRHSNRVFKLITKRRRAPTSCPVSTR